MKKPILLFAVLAFIPMFVDAQALKVRSDGNIEAFTPDASSVSEDNNSKLIIRSSRKSSLHIQRIGSTYYSGSDSYGIYSGNDPISDKYNYAIKGNATAPTALNKGRAYGVIGTAGNTSNGYNYGIVGHMYGTQNGAGVFGGLDLPQGIPGRYAGYFGGNVGVTGSVTAANFITNSDIRFKKDIVRLNKKGSVLQNVLNLDPVEYSLKQEYLTPATTGDTAAVAQKLLNEDAQQFNKKHFGLIAQDVQKLYPDLVYEDGNGYLSVNYTGLIPLLIESVKELNAEIDALKTTQKPELRDAMDAASTQQGSQPAILRQNTPNPFNQTTEIGYYIPQAVKMANIYIYDLNGAQQKNIAIVGRGDAHVTIEAATLKAGIYFYTLICDGSPIDSKQMILTK